MSFGYIVHTHPLFSGLKLTEHLRWIQLTQPALPIVTFYDLTITTQNSRQEHEKFHNAKSRVLPYFLLFEF